MSDQTISGGAGIGTAEVFGQHEKPRSCMGCRWLAVLPIGGGKRYRCGFGYVDAPFSVEPVGLLQQAAANCKEYAVKDN